MLFSARASRARVRVRRGSGSSEVLQIFERRQVPDFELYPETLRGLSHFLDEQGTLLKDIVEWLRTASAVMAGSQYGHFAGILFHPFECDLSSDLDAGSCRASKFCFPEGDGDWMLNFRPSRDHHGFTTASPLACGCIRLWITWMANRRGGQEHPVVLENFSTTVSTL